MFTSCILVQSTLSNFADEETERLDRWCVTCPRSLRRQWQTFAKATVSSCRWLQYALVPSHKRYSHSMKQGLQQSTSDDLSLWLKSSSMLIHFFQVCCLYPNLAPHGFSHWLIMFCHVLKFDPEIKSHLFPVDLIYILNSHSIFFPGELNGHLKSYICSFVVHLFNMVLICH